jgi:hypothetical protein
MDYNSVNPMDVPVFIIVYLRYVSQLEVQLQILLC